MPLCTNMQKKNAIINEITSHVFFVVAVILFSCLACNFFYHRFLIDGFGDVCCGTGGDSGCANLHCLLQEDTPHWTRWSREQSVIFTFSRSAVMMVINCSRRTVIKLQIQQSGVRLLIAEKGWKFISFAFRYSMEDPFAIFELCFPKLSADLFVYILSVSLLNHCSV